MRLSDLEYDLPERLIAQTPPTERSGARMLVLDRAAGRLEDRRFQDFPDYLRPSDRLVLNNTRVLPARLYGRRPSGGRAEALLVREISAEPPRWEALVRPGKKLDVGARIELDAGWSAEVVARGDGGLRTLEFSGPGEFQETIERIGHMPLPPYIKREDAEPDRERYQTVYARRSGSAAAPTAGLHFSPEVLDRVRAQGARTVEITLHVGLGTFQPIQVDDLADHVMHAERFSISPEAAADLRGPGRVVAVGTTSVRTLEHAARAGRDKIEAGDGETALFITPGFEFQAVDAMLTNFHLPGSTLLALVCAFAGTEATLAAYRHAVAEEYRFYSYGDCMLIV